MSGNVLLAECHILERLATGSWTSLLCDFIVCRQIWGLYHDGDVVNLTDAFCTICSYVHYSRVCARVVRRCLKPDLRSEAMKRDEGLIRAVFWKDGKPVTSMYTLCIICSYMAVMSELFLAHMNSRSLSLYVIVVHLSSVVCNVRALY